MQVFPRRVKAQDHIGQMSLPVRCQQTHQGRAKIRNPGSEATPTYGVQMGGLSARQRAKAPCHIPSSFAEKVIFRPPECGRYLPTLYWNAP